VSKTPYSAENQQFSDAAHLSAQKLLYPAIFGVECEQLTFETLSVGGDDKGALLDGSMGIDRIVRVKVPNLREYLSFTVQERFRKPCYARYRDITVTEWNHNSNLPSELYKLNAEIFLYGYYESTRHEFIEAIAINTTTFKEQIIGGKVPYRVERNPRSNQTFYCFRFDDLIQLGTTIFWTGHNGN
jgi:hypothetical protein